jgi:hypothetical protein
MWLFVSQSAYCTKDTDAIPMHTGLVQKVAVTSSDVIGIGGRFGLD